MVIDENELPGAKEAPLKVLFWLWWLLLLLLVITGYCIYKYNKDKKEAFEP